MSSIPYKSSIQYNPNPPRVWSRVQNSCSIIAYKNDDPAENSNFAIADYERQMLLKGNILQYKKNSSNLTKKQRYTQIAKGMWTNRTKTWATQSDTYSNPNMTSLLRVNSTILDPSNNTFSNRSNPFGCPTTSIQDGGNLVCNVVVDPCTQEVVKRTQSQQLCNPTSDSDVPGQIQALCWNDGTQTWYPRQRYIMPTSGTKWPVGYKGLVSAVTFIGPVLSVGTMACKDLNIPLNWTFLDSTCLPITSFNIYQNGVFILNVLAPQTSVTINQSGVGVYSFYVTSLSNDIESEKSNSVVVNTQIGYIITGNFTGTYDGITATIIFNTPGINTVQLFCPINNQTITCIGGGGGGGGGSNKQSGNPTESAGGGGGGGGVSIITGSILQIGDINTITVGSKGTPGGGNLSGLNGTHSSFSNTNGIMTSNGGGGGGGHYFGCGGGTGGSASITTFSPGNTYNGGNGGNGFQLSPSVTAANGISSGTSYSGGGGGGVKTAGGGAGNMGTGGIKGSATTSTGNPAISNSYGSGGGGSGCPSSSGNYNYGGNGANGAVIITFPYSS